MIGFYYRQNLLTFCKVLQIGEETRYMVDQVTPPVYMSNFVANQSNRL
ncbi:hypothetical protein EMIT074MI3_40124 [Bacillus licheniformis]